MSKVDATELSSLLESLNGIVNHSTDLPSNVFIGRKFVFRFFERPLFCFNELFCGLISESISSFRSKVYVKFLGVEPVVDSCFCITGGNVDEGVFLINKIFESFDEGRLGYPIVIFSENFEWVAFESAREEFGVIAVQSSVAHQDFIKALDLNFMSRSELSELALGEGAEGVIAKNLIYSYFDV
ncbi:hypothetical protein [Pseudomonas sp.]|uniref:hypothetical protein n=1 Tax=Pseudomonas sp. TaxID=306 RepID=UPI003D12D471